MSRVCVISGTTTVAKTLFTSAGTWSGQTPISFSYQWQSCAALCSAIPGATSSSYTLVPGDQGAMIAVIVTQKYSEARGAEYPTRPIAACDHTMQIKDRIVQIHAVTEVFPMHAGPRCPELPRPRQRRPHTRPGHRRDRSGLAEVPGRKPGLREGPAPVHALERRLRQNARGMSGAGDLTKP